MQLWSPTVVHLSLSNTYRLKKNRSLTTNVSPEELVEMFFKMIEPTKSCKSFASLPYFKGVTEPLTHVLKKQGVTVVNQPFTTLQQQFPAPKFRPSMDSQTNVVYKIPCTNCSWCYLGELAEPLIPEKKEHLRNIKSAAEGFRIANHTWSNPCKILTEISARISASFWLARLLRDLGEISKSRQPKTRQYLKILAAKNSPRISARFQVRSWRDLKVKVAKTSLRISARLQVRSRRDIRILEAKKILPRKLEVFLAMFPRYFKMSILRFR